MTKEIRVANIRRARSGVAGIHSAFGFWHSLDIGHSSFGVCNVCGRNSGLVSTLAPPGSKEKRWYAGHPFPIDHFLEMVRDSFDYPLNERLSLPCGGDAGIGIRLILPCVCSDVLRE